MRRPQAVAREFVNAPCSQQNALAVPGAPARGDCVVQEYRSDLVGAAVEAGSRRGVRPPLPYAARGRAGRFGRRRASPRCARRTRGSVCYGDTG